MGLDGKLGYIDPTGKIIIAAEYMDAGAFKEGLAPVARGVPRKWGFIDRTGKEVIPLQYDGVSISGFSDGVVFVSKHVDRQGRDKKWGVVDKTGREIVPPKYDNAQRFREGLAWVNVGGRVDPQDYYFKGGKWALIDKTGRVVIAPKYDNAYDFAEGLAAVNIGSTGLGLGGKWGFVDKTGKEVIPLKYDNVVYSFKGGKAQVRAGGRTFFIDTTGAEIGADGAGAAAKPDAPAVSQDLRPFQSEERLFGFKNEEGQIVIEAKYDNARHFFDGLGAVMTKGKWGFVDATGKEVIPPVYVKVRDFSEALAGVRLSLDNKDKIKFVDKKGNVILETRYDDAMRFQKGLVDVAINKSHLVKLWGLMDKTGREVVAPRYDVIGAFTEGLAAVRLNGKWGFIDTNGEEVIPVQFDGSALVAPRFFKGRVKVRQNGREFFIDKTGREVR